MTEKAFSEWLISNLIDIYTIEKKGVKELFCQALSYMYGEYARIVELSLEVPWEMPHFVRDE